MIQTYEGYFLEDGSFVPNGIRVKLPTRRRAIVNVFVEEVADDVNPQTDTETEDRVKRIESILAAAVDAKDDMTEDDWDEMLTLRSKSNAGLSRVVDI